MPFIQHGEDNEHDKPGDAGNLGYDRQDIRVGCQAHAVKIYDKLQNDQRRGNNAARVHIDRLSEKG